MDAGSNGIIFDDLEWPLTRLSRSRYTYKLKSQKRCVLGTELLKNTNRKSYTIYRMVPFSMTLSDLWPRFQGHDIFWTRISENRCVLKTKLLLHKRKLYLAYGMVLCLVTLIDL